jgi:tRNA A-37 threonylcarbamoyl transferase component Bud32
VIRNRKSKQVKTLDLTLDTSVKAFQYVNEKLLNKPIKDWSKDDISLWLDRGGFGQYRGNFESNHIAGNTLLELTEQELENEIGITHVQHRKKIMKDIRFLKKIFPRNTKESKFIREKLLKFYENNKNKLFAEPNPEQEENQPTRNSGEPKSRERTLSVMKDVFDTQDRFEKFRLKTTKPDGSSSSSSSGSSSSSDSDSEIPSKTKGDVVPLQKKSSNEPRKILENKRKVKFDEAKALAEGRQPQENKPQQKSKPQQDEPTEENVIGKESPKQKKRQVTDDPINDDTKPQIVEGKKSEMSFQVSEFHTTFNRYKEYEGDLLQTVKETLGRRCFIDHLEIQIQDKIGEGGYGEVFKGTWLGQDVAIKFYGKKKSRNKARIDADFLKEVEVFSRLRHPNILLFMGVSVTPQYKGLLITEYLEGGSLFDHLHKRGTKFTEERLINIALDMALGMNYLHAKKILHCDLKSSNILLDEHFNVKLADFGLSKVRKKIQGRKHKRIGTPHWMAPEIMREEEYDEYSDVYSFGMILWELIARKIPYFGLKVNQIVGSVGYGENQVQIPEKGNPIISNLIQKCLNKDRGKRPDFKTIVHYLENSDKQLKYIVLQELDHFFDG